MGLGDGQAAGEGFQVGRIQFPVEQGLDVGARLGVTDVAGDLDEAAFEVRETFAREVQPRAAFDALAHLLQQRLGNGLDYGLHAIRFWRATGLRRRSPAVGADRPPSRPRNQGGDPGLPVQSVCPCRKSG